MESVKELQAAIEEVLPKECELTKVEVEGPQVVLYLKNVKAFYDDEHLITKIAGRTRRKIALRCDESVLMNEETAMKKIKAAIPHDAGVTDITFDRVFHEVIIEALKPGLAIGKGGLVLKSIILDTGWAPKVLRAPTSPSEVVRAIRASMVRQSEDRKKFLNTLGKKMLIQKSACDWVKITALGAYREIGRACTLLQTPRSNILIDCGMNNDTSDPQRAFPYLNAMNLSFDQLDAVILTHAHLDHSGFLPYLYAYGYEGPIYCTPPTRDLSILLQQDAIGVLNKEGKGAPYGERDIKKELAHFIVRDYGEVTDITPEIRFTFHNAGHILGSALVHLHIGEGLYNIVHSGDLKYGFTRLLDPADARYPRIDSLFLESTYGGPRDITANRQESEIQLMELIKRVLENKGKVLLPVLSVGRAQELMVTLETYVANNPQYKLDVPIYLDGMILEASAIHTAYPEYLKAGLQHRILSNNSPFESEIFEVAKGERSELLEKGPCVVLASGGMLNGGTALEYFKALAEDEKNAIVFSSYTSVNSLGRKVINGFKEIPLPGDDGKLVPINIKMQVHRSEGFSGHSDRRQLMSFVQNLRPGPKKIFTMHGEEAKCDDLARTLGMRFHVEGRAPMNLDSIRFK